jgi:hypothetical protein
MPSRERTSDYIWAWARRYCACPDGRPIELTPAEFKQVVHLYDVLPLDSPPASEPITGRLAAILTLVHISSKLATGKHPPPATHQTNVFAVWGMCGSRLREVLRRSGERILCPAIGTCWQGNDPHVRASLLPH